MIYRNDYESTIPITKDSREVVLIGKWCILNLFEINQQPTKGKEKSNPGNQEKNNGVDREKNLAQLVRSIPMQSGGYLVLP
jgi:hypothetical protein